MRARHGGGVVALVFYHRCRPTQFNPPASKEFVASRLDAFEAYGVDWISIWVINPGSPECPTMNDVEERWAPWIPRLKSFLNPQPSREADL